MGGVLVDMERLIYFSQHLLSIDTQCPALFLENCSRQKYSMYISAANFTFSSAKKFIIQAKTCVKSPFHFPDIALHLS